MASQQLRSLGSDVSYLIGVKEFMAAFAIL